MVTMVKTINYRYKELQEGDLFGMEELVLYGSVARCVSATALTDCELDFVDKMTFFQSNHNSQITL
jgi:CRP-like cAMP-binding protein